MYLSMQEKIYVLMIKNFEVWFIISEINDLNREKKKFSRLTMGFGYFMYSHSLVPVIDPWGLGRDKVGIRAMVSLLNFKIDVLCFLTLLRY